MKDDKRGSYRRKKIEYQKILNEWRQKVAEIPESTAHNRLDGENPYKELEKIYLPKLRALGES